MSEDTVFPRAPITEALLDIRVELPKRTVLKDLEAFQKDIREVFSQKQTRVSFTAKIPIKDVGVSPPSIATSGGADGLMFRSPEEQKVVQARLDGFTFNKLKPYEQWAIFRDEARNLWNVYYEIAKPVRVTRIALRYINRIEIPFPIRDFKDYILTVPEIAPTLPQGLQQFFMRLDIPMPNGRVMARITQTLEKRTEVERLPFIFDIDVWQLVDYEGQANEMWDEFKKLREIKNKIFFESITEKTKELFR